MSASRGEQRGDRRELAADARRERRLVLQALLALAVVAVLVVIREVCFA